MRGNVNSVMILLHAVSVTDNATSPFASMENTLLELPPGQHATSIMPMMNNGVWCMAYGVREQIPQAINGSRIICPTNPISTGLGRSAISRKSAGLSVKPKSNIMSVNIGSTMKMVFIIQYSLRVISSVISSLMLGIPVLPSHLPYKRSSFADLIRARGASRTRSLRRFPRGESC